MLQCKHQHTPEMAPPHTYTQRHVGRVQALVGSGGGGVVVAAGVWGGCSWPEGLYLATLRVLTECNTSRLLHLQDRPPGYSTLPLPSVTKQKKIFFLMSHTILFCGDQLATRISVCHSKMRAISGIPHNEARTVNFTSQYF